MLFTRPNQTLFLRGPKLRGATRRRRMVQFTQAAANQWLRRIEPYGAQPVGVLLL
jgi:hypothetical protein